MLQKARLQQSKMSDAGAPPASGLWGVLLLKALLPSASYWYDCQLAPYLSPPIYSQCRAKTKPSISFG